MAPAKRITRGAKANQSGKAASKRKDESIDSGYGGSGRLSRTASPSDSGEPALPAKKPRTATHNVRDTSPGKSRHRAGLPGLATSLHTTRKNPRKLAPKKKDWLTAVIPEEAPHDNLMSPVDRQLQSETVATTLFQQSLDWEVEHVRRMFSTPRSRSDPQQMHLYFNALRTYPSTDEAFKQRYQALRNAAWTWAQDSFPVVDAPLDLMHLATHAPELMEYFNATTAGPSAGTWERLLSTKRAEIVYSILGKALEVHIFGEELFGASPQQKRKLQMADREMFDADGFSRQTTRSNYIHTLLPTFPFTLHPALQALVSRLRNLLTPLSPTSPDTEPHLFTLTLLAAKLHLDTRLYRTAIYHFSPTPPPGAAFSAEEMTPHASASANHHHHHHQKQKKKRKPQVAAITGWPALIAYRPIVPLPPSSPFHHNTRQNGKKGVKRGISTHVLAHADVFVDSASTSVTGARRGLRAEMRHRVVGMMEEEEEEEEEETRRIDAVRRRAAAGVAAAGLAVGVGLWSGWGLGGVRGVMGTTLET